MAVTIENLVTSGTFSLDGGGTWDGLPCPYFDDLVQLEYVHEYQ